MKLRSVDFRPSASADPDVDEALQLLSRVPAEPASFRTLAAVGYLVLFSAGVGGVVFMAARAFAVGITLVVSGFASAALFHALGSMGRLLHFNTLLQAQGLLFQAQQRADSRAGRSS